MSDLRLFLLGPPRVELAGVPVAITRRKALALVSYLAVTGERQRRDTLAALLWPDSASRSGLRRDLSILNTALTERWLDIDRESVGLHPGFWLDVAQFQQHLSDCAATPAACREALTAAAALYRGDFLTGFTLPDCRDFDEWQFFQAEQLRQQFGSALERLIGIVRAQHDTDAALAYARRWLALDPLHEPAHQALMEIYARAEHPTAALRQYQECQRLLAKELGVEPADELTALYDRIRLGRATSASHDAASLSDEADRLPVAGLHAAGEPAAHKTVDALAGPPPAFLHEGVEPAQALSTPFVARERELAELDRFLLAALMNQGRVVFVTGEAGSGKTALVREFAARAQERQDDLIVAVGSCNVYTGVGDPYLPFRDILGMLTGDVESLWEAGKITRNHALRLWQLLPHTTDVLLDHGPDLINRLVPGKALVERLTAYGSGAIECLVRWQAQQLRSKDLGTDQNRLFEAYSAVLAAIATRQPLCLILDDLQWADTSSIGLLFHLGRRLTNSRVLIIGTYRPEDVALGWPGSVHPLEEVVSEFKRRFGTITIDLDQIERAGGRYFIDAILDTEPNQLDEDFRQALFRHSHGHPLFTVELLRDMQDRNDLIRDTQGRWVASPDLSWERMPAKVEGVVERRIGRLAPELWEALTIASVEGETFTAEVVASAQAVDAHAFIRRLSSELERRHRLVHAQQIHRLGAKRISRYRFRHHLFQRYLYTALDQVTRAYLHEDVGRALEHLHHEHPDELAAVAGQLAWHFQEAGVTEKALDYRFVAGQQAVRLSANAEAVDHFSKALALLYTLPDMPERTQRELSLQIALGVPVTAVKGYAHPDVETVYARACTLCRQVGDTAHLFPALYGLWRFYVIRSELLAARELADQLMQLAQNATGQELMVEAYRAVGINSFHLGEFPAARAAFEHGLALYDAQGHRPHAFVYGHDPAVSCLGYLAHTLWLLGYIDQALERTNDVLALARNLAHPFSLGHALVWDAAKLHQFCGNARKVQAIAEEGIALATKHAFPFWETQGRIMLGWALAQQGRIGAGIAEMHHGLAAWQATGARSLGPYFLSLLAEAYGRADKAERGLAILADALAAVERTGERWWAAELYHLEGELRLLQGADPLEVETCFRRALTIARQQQAHTLELRATMSLCRLWQKQGKVAEAQQVLIQIYGWFTEGRDSRDVQEAERLFHELKTFEAGSRSARDRIRG